MDTPDQKLVSIRAMDAAVAIALLIASGVVIMDSLRLGVRWNEIDGPAAGYFPFYIGVILALASVVNLVKAVSVDRAAGARTFVTQVAFRRVLAVLLPLSAYVVILNYIGIYAASAIYIALFMRYVGKHSLLHGIAVGLGVAISLFMMFEVWFLVPLPKGPIENWLGY
jgi:putative tricarboxylic transport membrane protein